MKRTNKKGFTIVELVIVIAVIAILAAVMIPTFSGIVEKAQESAALQKASAAYKEAYALALADGKIVTDANAADKDVYPVGHYTFTFGGSLESVTCDVADNDNDGYTVSWDTTTKTIKAEKTNP